MDSIEKMRRINDLTKELKQRGFADSSFEAIQQAHQIYGTDDVEDNVKHGIIQKSVHERMGAEPDDSVPYADRKFAKLQENIDLLTNKMNEIVRAINDLDSRISEVKTKQDKVIVLVNQLSAEPRHETRSEPKIEHPVQSVPEARQGPEPQAAAQSAKDEYSFNQRTGSFESKDVAIDKMFYYGKK